MSIWSCAYEVAVFKTDYQPHHRSWTVDLHTAASWNDCIRLGMSGPSGEYQDVMLDRATARDLGSALQRFGTSGHLEETA